MNKMTRVVILSTLVLGMSGTFAFAEDERYEKLAQESQRNRELQEIWKEHVRTLTQERDDALKEIEQLKVGAQAHPMAQFGGIETQMLPPSPDSMAKIQGLESEVLKLGAQLAEKNQNSDSAQLQRLVKELQETKADKDRLIQEKEKALSQLERYTQGTQTLDLESLKEENKSLKLQVRTLKVQLSNVEESSQLLAAENRTFQQKDQQRSNGDEQLAGDLEATHAKLKTNLSDMKNLRKNINSYLDSLIAAFDERTQ